MKELRVENASIETNMLLAKFKPRPYQEVVIDAIENKGYKKVLLNWHRRCLSGNTHIVLSNVSFKFLKNINIGDEILSWD